MYEYQAKIIKVVDGDTLDVEIDLGFEISHRIRLRLMNVYAAERYTAEGKEATKRLSEKLPAGAMVNVKTIRDKTEKYGRYLANVTLNEGTFLNEWLVQQGLASREPPTKKADHPERAARFRME